MIKLILGCGYLGRRVADRWRVLGHEVLGVVSHAEHARQIAAAGILPILADVTEPATLRALPPAETALYCVGYDPAGRKSRREVYVEGLGNVLRALAPVTRRIIFISSTGVFGEAGGEWLDEESPCRPAREAARALLAAEQQLLAHPLGDLAVVLRLAGLYGPGRLPQAVEIRSGRPLTAAERCWVNLIHVDDAAAVVVAAEARARPPRTYLVSDGHPVQRREYLGRLAELLGAPPPVFCPGKPASSGRGAGQKRVRNTRMLAELGVRLLYPSYREGLAAAVRDGMTG
jgi:nucleoside-diphosphate-sugar epimerase